MESILGKLQTGMVAPAYAGVIYSKGDLLYEYAGGIYFVDTGKKQEPVTAHTLFDVASVTKLYTTALILNLCETGKLNIFDRNGKYLSNFQDSELRICDLLSHKAVFNIRLAEYRAIYKTSVHFTEWMNNLKPALKKSKKVVYENLPFLYLGQIIEKVTKKSLAEVFQDFLQKQGLNNTICGTKEDLLSIYSPPTERFNNQLIQNVTHDETARLLGGIAGNAGIFTSAHDLARFGQMWLDDTIVSDRQLFSMIWQDYDDSGKNPQGFGWFGRLFGKSLAETGVFVHPGFTGCMLAINLQKSKVCAFTCNRTMLGRNNKKHQDIMHALVQFIQ